VDCYVTPWIGALSVAPDHPGRAAAATQRNIRALLGHRSSDALFPSFREFKYLRQRRLTLFKATCDGGILTQEEQGRAQDRHFAQ